MKKIHLLASLILFAGMMLHAQNMERYITLGVQSGTQIELQFSANAEGTPVKIVSGSEEILVEVGPNLSSLYPYMAGDSVMTIYGDIISLDCEENDEKITSIDLSHNKKLEQLYCYYNAITELDVSMLRNLKELECDNNFITSLDLSNNHKLELLSCFQNPLTTEAIDDIYCSLHDKTEMGGNGIIYVLNSPNDEGYDNVMASNKQNAIAKNWQVYYFDDYDGPLSNTDIPETNGDYTCPASIIADNLNKIAKIEVYPIPAKDDLHIAIEDESFTLKLHTLQGKLLLEKQNSKKVSVAHLPSGVYVLEVISNRGVFTKKIMLHK